MSKTAAVDSTLSAARIKCSPVVAHFTTEYLQCKYRLMILIITKIRKVKHEHNV